MPAPEVVIHRASCEAILRGHPWIWRSSVLRAGASVAGEEVSIVAPDGRRLGHGIFDPESPLAVRVWTRDAPLDADLVRRRADRAVEIRRTLFKDGSTTAYRVIHGEGDRLPGLVVDRYLHVGVLRPDGAAAEAVARRFARPLAAALGSIGVSTLVLRTTPRGKDVSLEPLAGEGAPPDHLEVKEHGIPFIVDLARGQKTGAFLDQRENRRRVGALASKKEVLNLFSYAGGFSLHAALGGATSVTSVDSAAGAHSTAQASFRAAGIDPSAYAFIAADAFAFLDQAKKRGASWDLIVSDPPSFAPSERALPRALAAYRGLHRACAEVLRPGGTFCASSCSSHVDMQAFASTLDDAALGRSDLSLLELYGAPADHPTLAAWPEGRYLKFAVLA
jgi:23S rRNA (cytosine1962-C5)-methyltransferase